MDFRIHVEEFLDGPSKINAFFASKPIFKVETLVNEHLGKPFKIWNILLLNKDFQNKEGFVDSQMISTTCNNRLPASNLPPQIYFE